MIDLFFKNYRLLYRFLGTLFCEMDLDDKSEFEIISEYKTIIPVTQLNSLKEEFNNLFKNRDTNHEYISDLSNIYLETDEEMYEWLHELYGYLFEDE